MIIYEFSQTVILTRFNIIFIRVAKNKFFLRIHIFSSCYRDFCLCILTFKYINLSIFYTILGYKIIKKIGEGSFSVVVKTQSLKDGKMYACKTMKQTINRWADKTFLSMPDVSGKNKPYKG